MKEQIKRSTGDLESAKKIDLPAFPVVGIGASAGGLTALLRLFENMPAAMGMAFIVVQHLPKSRESVTDQIIQRTTRMPVRKALSQTKIEKDSIYIVPETKSPQLEPGHLELIELHPEFGARTIIDRFFSSLAGAYQERAIAIVLSGTGTDGSVGIGKIREQGGVSLVQDPSDAEHDAMPRASISTGIVDFVLPVSEIPQKLIELWSNASQIDLPKLDILPQTDDREPLLEDDDETLVTRIISVLESHTGYDFKDYKQATILRRIERRMQVCMVPTLSDYVPILETDPDERLALLGDMLIGVTNFFRDRVAFDTLERDFIEELVSNRDEHDDIRVWVAACSTGEEAYSLAVLLAEQVALSASPPTYQVFASDINDAALKFARTAIYSSAILPDVAPARLRNFFLKMGDQYQIREFVRDRVLFAAHNLLKDPPFSKLDLISCRNLLIYLNRDAQAHILKSFHYALKPGGLLFLGSAESTDAASDCFDLVDKNSRIYRARSLSQTFMPVPSYEHAGVIRASLPAIAKPAVTQMVSYADLHQRALIEQAAPSVIVDSKFHLLHVSARAGRYMRMAGGEPTSDIVALALPELRRDLRVALFQAQRQGQSSYDHRVALTIEGHPTVVKISARHFQDKEVGNVILVSFEEGLSSVEDFSTSTAHDPAFALIAQLESDAQSYRNQLLEAIESAQFSNEELRASNEELVAINEELRSITEELEANREELRSVNEELSVVNSELESRLEDIHKANDDLNNLIESTDIAAIFIDRDMKIKRFTPRVADIFRVITADVGRPLFDIVHNLDYRDFRQDVAVTLEKRQPFERKVHGHNGLRYIVRLRPSLSAESKGEGIVIVFIDVTAYRGTGE